MTTRVDNNGHKIGADEALRRCGEAFEAARKYFKISDEWNVAINADTDHEDSSAWITPDLPYLRASVGVNVNLLRRRPDLIWAAMGHECAHLTQAEYDLAWDAAKSGDEVLSEAAVQLFELACERTTTRLERMFLRDCPDPHHPAKEVKRA